MVARGVVCMEGETKPEEIASFLERKGAVPVFCALENDEKRFTDVNDEVDISHTTLGELLNDGVEIDVFERTFGGAGTDRLYQLTPLGKTVMFRIRKQGLIQTYSLLKEIEERYETEKESLIEWVLNVDDFRGSYVLARKFERFQDIPVITDSDVNDEILDAIGNEDDGYTWGEDDEQDEE